VIIGSNVTFAVSASGSAPLYYQWFENNQSIAGATNTTLFIPNAQPTDAGQYFAIASNAVNTAASNVATLNVLSTFQAWQMKHFGCTNCSQADATADSDGDGLNNLAEFLSGSDPTNNASALRIISVAPQNNGDMLITWRTVGGYTNAVQATIGDASGSYNTNFVDITTPPHIIVSGSGDVTTNYTDGGGATNPSRFYRVRLVP
jgi:hypothetical protein